MKDHGKCPKCGVSWDAGDVLEVLTAKFPNETETTLRDWASSHGWTETNRVRFGRELVRVWNDRAQEYMCPDCGHRVPI